jgi:hypothetical protein
MVCSPAAKIACVELTTLRMVLTCLNAVHHSEQLECRTHRLPANGVSECLSFPDDATGLRDKLKDNLERQLDLYRRDAAVLQALRDRVLAHEEVPLLRVAMSAPHSIV